MKLLILVIILILLCFLYLHENKIKEPFYVEKHNTIIALFIKLCNELKLNYKIINKNVIKIADDNKDITFKSFYTYHPINSIEIRKKLRDKHYTNHLLRKNNIKAPLSNIYNSITSLNQLNDIVNKTNDFPCVVKPNDSHGGIKVFVNIKNKQQLKNILKNEFLNKKIAGSTSQKIIIENYLKGESYRIMCYKDKILDVVYREDIYVIGDGINDIETLVNMKNKLNASPYTNRISNDHLKSQNLTKKSIPPNGKKIVVNIPKMHRGSKRLRFPIDKIHPDNINMIKKIMSICEYSHIGIDFIVEDITKSYKTQNCGINEINASAPSFDVHYYADNKKNLDIPKKFLKLYFNL